MMVPIVENDTFLRRSCICARTCDGIKIEVSTDRIEKQMGKGSGTIFMIKSNFYHSILPEMVNWNFY